MDTLPSTAYHSQPVRDFNRAAAQRPPIDLSEAALVAAARADAGLHEFGDQGFTAPLRVLLDAIEAEAALNPFGRMAAQIRTVGSLKNRLWAQACFERHPDIRRRELAAPLIIVGPHRSGTTRLHRMLALDPRLRHLRTWEGIHPAPRAPAPGAHAAERRAEAQAALEGRDAAYPGAYAAHPMHADWPEEEMLLLNHCFSGFTPLGLYHVPRYYRWFLEADKGFAYRDMADLMKLIEWSAGEDGRRPWLLKNPQHMLDLPALLAQFPDARLVFTHRDPIKTVGSTLSLMWLYSVQHTDAPCRARVRETWLDFCEQAARRCIDARATIPAAQQLDVRYEDMNRDWRAVLRSIYAFCEMEFTPQAEEAMAQWLERSRAERLHGEHRYLLRDFGLDAGEIDARMRFYRERYAIPYEDPR
jgi:hypothetical protein